MSRDTCCIICGNGTYSDGDITRCVSCGHFKFPSYDKQVYFENNSKGKQYLDYEVNGNGIQLASLRVGMMMGVGLQSGMTLLDIGAAIGTVCKVAEDEGIKAHGIDVNSQAVLIAKEKGRSVSLTDFENPHIFAKAYAVSLFDILEHFNDIHSVLSRIETKIISISTPCADGLTLDNVKSWRHYRPLEHIHGFTTKSLKYLLSQYAYTNINVSYLESIFRPYDNRKENILTITARHA